MGNISSLPNDQKYSNEAWISLDTRVKNIQGQPTLSQNIKTNIRGYEYIVDVQSQQLINRQISIYEARKITNHHLINVYTVCLGDLLYQFGKMEKKKKIFRVITEEILWSLADYHNLSNEEGLYLIQGILNGCYELIQYSGLFTITDKMIGINHHGKVKIWLNSNYSLNIFQINNITPSNQSQMILGIFHIVQNHLLNKQFPQYISNHYINFKTIPEALKFISSIICSKYSHQIGFNLINKMIITHHNHLVKTQINQQIKSNQSYYKEFNNLLKTKLKQQITIKLEKSNQQIFDQLRYTNSTDRNNTPKYYQSLRHSLQPLQLKPRLTHVNSQINHTQFYNSHQGKFQSFNHSYNNQARPLGFLRSNQKEKLKQLNHNYSNVNINKHEKGKLINYKNNKTNTSTNACHTLNNQNISNIDNNNICKKKNFKKKQNIEYLTPKKQEKRNQGIQQKLNRHLNVDQSKTIYKRFQKQKSNYHKIFLQNKKRQQFSKQKNQHNKIRLNQKHVSIKTQQKQQDSGFQFIKDQKQMLNQNSSNQKCINSFLKVKRCSSMEAFQNYPQKQLSQSKSYTINELQKQSNDNFLDRVQQTLGNQFIVDTQSFIGDHQINLYDFNLDQYSKRPLTKIQQQYYTNFLCKSIQNFENQSQTSIRKIKNQKELQSLKSLTALMKKQVNSYEDIYQKPQIKQQHKKKSQNIYNNIRNIKLQNNKYFQMKQNLPIGKQIKKQNDLNLRLTEATQQVKQLQIIQQTERDMETGDNSKLITKNLYQKYKYFY